MWLPTSVYERLPQFWLLVGLVIMASSVYLGFSYKYSLWYFGIGLISAAWSGVIIMLRARNRDSAARPDMQETSEDLPTDRPQ